MRAPSTILCLLALSIAALAGCLAGEDVPLPDAGTAADGVGIYGATTPSRLPVPDFDFSAAIDPDHGGIPDGHAIAALHAHEFGLELVGYNPLSNPAAGDDPLSQDSSYAAVDTWENFVCVAHFAGTGGFTLVDIADPAAPTVVSSMPSGMVNSDCQFTDDGNHLLLASYTGVHGGLAPGAPVPLYDLAAQGVLVYDVTDKAAPTLLFHDAQGAGGDGYHNVFTANIHGTDYVFQTYTGNILALDPGATSFRMVGQVEIADHDMWVGKHPITGTYVMITGAGPGTRIYDLEDPANPMLIGEWVPEEGSGLAGWNRQWPLLETVDGRAYVVVGGETGGGSSLPYSVLDMTDPSDITLVGSWQIPGAPASPEPNFYTMSAHEFEVWDGYVATGNYHAGVWLFDVGSADRAAEPVSLAYYLPHEVAQASLGATNKPFAFNPYTWGAYFDERGYVITADWYSGLYVLKFGATMAEPGHSH